jgi:tetratricopeptide (TPR) repeat protein
MPSIARLTRSLAVLAAVVGAASPALAGAVEDGQKLLGQKRHAEAADRFAEALAKDASDRGAALGLARAAAGGRLVDRLADAEVAVSRVIKQNAEDAEARAALGHVFLALAPTKDDPKAMEFVYRDAMDQFQKALATDPAQADAGAGLAQVHWQMGSFDQAIEAADALLAKKPDARALYWKGQAYYELARARYASGPTEEATLALFRKARGSYEAAVQLDKGSYDAWMQLAYASQYLGDAASALEAYLKAAALDPESHYPLKGVRALTTGDDARYVAALEDLAKAVPGNVAVHLFLGYAHYGANRWEPAAACLATFVEKSSTPRAGLVPLGRSLAKLGKEAEAVKAFEKALALEPRDFEAADELDRRLREKHAQAAAQSVSNAKAAADDYERLLALTKENPFVPNNGAFILREAYVRHQGESAWVPVLKSAVKLYEAAAQIVDDQPYEVVEQAAWGDRYGWAQITSDTGLMFQFYEPTFDAKKAETYYLRALKLTNDGYFDAWNNLHKLYLSQKEHQKAYDLAARAAEGLAQESGEPHGTGRAAARAEMNRLVNEGKAKAD